MAAAIDVGGIVRREWMKGLALCLLWLCMGCSSSYAMKGAALAEPYGSQSNRPRAKRAPRVRLERSVAAGVGDTDDFERAAQPAADLRLAQNGPPVGTPAPSEAKDAAHAPPAADGTKLGTQAGQTKAPAAKRSPSKATSLLIYTATLHLAVFEAKVALAETQKLAEKAGGYLVKRNDNSIVVRVPTKQFKGALDAIASKGDVLHRKENVEDVTERFYDLMTRLNNARTMRARFVKLLDKADTVKDALAVERELARVTTVIEGLEGKLKRMKELIQFSTITVLFKPAPVQRVNSKVKLPFRWLNRLGLPHLLRL